MGCCCDCYIECLVVKRQIFCVCAFELNVYCVLVWFRLGVIEEVFAGFNGDCFNLGRIAGEI